MPYLVHAYGYTIKCEKCGCDLVLDYYPIPFPVGFFTGFATIVVVASFCLYVLHWSLLTSAVVSIAILLIPLLLACYIVLQRITFKKL